MASSMKVLLLLLLLDAGTAEAAVAPDNEVARIRGLWKMQMKEMKGKDSSPPIRDAAAHQLLYCRAGIGYHLQILPNGSVGGVHKPNDNCWLKVFAMKRGVVGIKGVKANLYLCLSADGAAYGSVRASPNSKKHFSDECLLKETLEENLYTTFSSLIHPGVFLALSRKGELRRGNRVGRHQASTHFLPRWLP